MFSNNRAITIIIFINEVSYHTEECSCIGRVHGENEDSRVIILIKKKIIIRLQVSIEVDII